MFAETGIDNIRKLVEAAHFLSIEQASELMADRDALAAELAEARKALEWIESQVPDEAALKRGFLTGFAMDLQNHAAKALAARDSASKEPANDA